VLFGGQVVNAMSEDPTHQAAPQQRSGSCSSSGSSCLSSNRGDNVALAVLLNRTRRKVA